MNENIQDVDYRAFVKMSMIIQREVKKFKMEK
jgi:hypothetical protein